MLQKIPNFILQLASCNLLQKHYHVFLCFVVYVQWHDLNKNSEKLILNQTLSPTSSVTLKIAKEKHEFFYSHISDELINDTNFSNTAIL